MNEFGLLKYVWESQPNKSVVALGCANSIACMACPPLWMLTFGVSLRTWSQIDKAIKEEKLGTLMKEGGD